MAVNLFDLNYRLFVLFNFDKREDIGFMKNFDLRFLTDLYVSRPLKPQSTKKKRLLSERFVMSTYQLYSLLMGPGLGTR